MIYDSRPTQRKARKVWDHFTAKYGSPESIGCGRDEFGTWLWVADYPSGTGWWTEPANVSAGVRSIPCCVKIKKEKQDLPKEQARVRQLLEFCLELGPAGAFACSVYRLALAEAEEAAISGDIVRIVQAYEGLRSCK